MPELPEVETTVNAISGILTKRQIKFLKVYQPKLRYFFKSTWLNSIVGQKIINVKRRGKYIIINLQVGALIVHLGMTGKLFFSKPNEPLKKHDHFDLNVGQFNLRYNDPRRFGCLIWTKSEPLKHKLIIKLGEEPFSNNFTGTYLYERRQKHKTSIKNFIMNNKVVVGVGNIYANEALFLAGINPKTKACNISLVRFNKLVLCIRNVLNQAIEAGGTTLQDYFSPLGEPGYFKTKLYVYGREHEQCRNCKTTIKKVIIGQRSSFYCYHCQT
ncbi:bifunctional DNA-formamidopyrimidine glycosylase/DNA-(apurinic or apyrimidinic site) lyase [Pseudomonadota bacterium]|mgnify:CR=1 FL=1|nr:bifunctional DNA-formamidopyrimidine glycosylase/DNA-(apurinic or apyrimidinic site) lyase [Pseudomonadota bacterium]